jgi:hypothetical protein
MSYFKALLAVLLLWAWPSMAQVTALDTTGPANNGSFYTYTNFDSIVLSKGPQSGETTVHHLNAMFASLFQSGAVSTYYAHAGTTTDTDCTTKNVIRAVSGCSHDGCHILSDFKVCTSGFWRIHIYNPANPDVVYVNAVTSVPTQTTACKNVQPYTVGLGQSQVTVAGMVAREFIRMKGDGSTGTDTLALAYNGAYTATNTACVIRGWAFYAPGSATIGFNKRDLQPLANARGSWMSGLIWRSVSLDLNPASSSNWAGPYGSSVSYGYYGPTSPTKQYYANDFATDALVSYVGGGTWFSSRYFSPGSLPTSYDTQKANGAGVQLVSEFGNGTSQPPTRYYAVGTSAGQCSVDTYGAPNTTFTFTSLLWGNWLSPGTSQCSWSTGGSPNGAAITQEFASRRLIKVTQDMGVVWNQCSVGNWCVGVNGDYNGNLSGSKPGQLSILSIPAETLTPYSQQVTAELIRQSYGTTAITDRQLIPSGPVSVNCVGSKSFSGTTRPFCEIMYNDSTQFRILRTMKIALIPGASGDQWVIVESGPMASSGGVGTPMPGSMASRVESGNHYSVAVVAGSDHKLYVSTRVNFGAWSTWLPLPFIDWNSPTDSVKMLTSPTVTGTMWGAGKWYVVFGGRLPPPV